MAESDVVNPAKMLIMLLISIGILVALFVLFITNTDFGFASDIFSF